MESRKPANTKLNYYTKKSDNIGFNYDVDYIYSQINTSKPFLLDFIHNYGRNFAHAKMKNPQSVIIMNLRSMNFNKTFINDYKHYNELKKEIQSLYDTIRFNNKLIQKAHAGDNVQEYVEIISKANAKQIELQKQINKLFLGNNIIKSDLL